jgi:hypothetical protein
LIGRGQTLDCKLNLIYFFFNVSIKLSLVFILIIFKFSEMSQKSNTLKDGTKAVILIFFIFNDKNYK